MNKYTKKIKKKQTKNLQIKQKQKIYLEYVVNDSTSSSKGFFNLFPNNINKTYKDD